MKAVMAATASGLSDLTLSQSLTQRSLSRCPLSDGQSVDYPYYLLSHQVLSAWLLSFLMCDCRRLTKNNTFDRLGICQAALPFTSPRIPGCLDHLHLNYFNHHTSSKLDYCPRPNHTPNMALNDTGPSTTAPLTFTFSPPLPSRYNLRHLTLADRPACIRVISHSFMFHNAIDTPWNEHVDSYHPLAAFFFDHAMAAGTDNYSFVITDMLSSKPPRSTCNGTHAAGHDADVASLMRDTDIVGVVICYDASRIADLDSLRSHTSFMSSQVSHDLYVLLDTLYQNDLRADPAHLHHHRYQPTAPGAQPAAPQPGNTIECFLLATQCQYNGEKLASYLCQAVYQLGVARGFECLETVATHPATAHIFTQLGGGRTVVTHRIQPKELKVKRADGSEWQPWAEVRDDMVALHVPIARDNEAAAA